MTKGPNDYIGNDYGVTSKLGLQSDVAQANVRILIDEGANMHFVSVVFC